LKKIITAINNPDLNLKLKELKMYEVVSKDIQYKEGILEILEKTEKVDTIILKEDIPGEKDLKEFVLDLLYLKNSLEIIIFLKNNDIETINFLKNKGISKIYSDEKISLENVIKSLEDIKIQETENIEKIAISGAPGVRKKRVFNNFS